LANFAGARSAFPGGDPPDPRAAVFPAHWPLANFAGARSAFPGGDPRDPPRGPLSAGGLGSAGPVPSVSGPPRGSPRAARSPSGGRGRPARFRPCLAPRAGPPAARSQVGGQPCWPGSVRAWALALDAPGLCAPRPHGPAGLRGAFSVVCAENAPRKPNSAGNVTHIGVPGDSGVGKAAGGSGAGKEHPRPRRGGYEDGDVWVARGSAGGWRRGRGDRWRPQDQYPPEARGGRSAGLSGGEMVAGVLEETATP